MKIAKPEDSKAKAIRFGVEVETAIPVSAGVAIGVYHIGTNVRSATTPDGLTIEAPKFRNSVWKAERDGSIRCDSGYQPCEFVSPILYDEDGVKKLREALNFMRAIGAKVNESCGLHVTVGIESIIGTNEAEAVAKFCRKLAHVAQANAWAIYAQTGTGRHRNHFSHTLADEVEMLMRNMVRQSEDRLRLQTYSRQCGRGMINFSKVFTHGVVEFRAFAGTLNEKKVLHHLATVFGICRRAETVQQFGKFKRTATKKHSVISNSVEALRRMWRLLGWVDSVPNRDCALGLFGALHAEFGKYRKAAIEMAEQFEQRFPNANL